VIEDFDAMTSIRHAPMPGRPLDVNTCDSPRTIDFLQAYAFGDGELMQPLPQSARARRTLAPR
jgi:hypothetical protein